MAIAREPKTELHTCTCGARLEVAYLDDRRDHRAAAPPVLSDVACPACGKPKALSLPAGAEKTVRVEAGEPAVDDGEGVSG
jgi:hypothetical protein